MDDQDLLSALMIIDECLVAHDVNAALKKVHECIAKIKERESHE